MTSLLFYKLFRHNPGLAGLGTASVSGRFLLGILIMAVILQGIGIAGFLAAIGALPQHVAWYVAFPSVTLAEGISNAVLGLLLTKILYPFVDRIGLTPPSSGVEAFPRAGLPR